MELYGTEEYNISGIGYISLAVHMGFVDKKKKVEYHQTYSLAYLQYSETHCCSLCDRPRVQSGDHYRSVQPQPRNR